MSKTPVRGGEEVVAALIHHGFVVMRQKGSHVILIREHITVVVPVHSNRDLPVGTLKQIMKITCLSAQDF